MSNYANRNAKQPDVSPKRKQNFSVRDRTIAIMLVAVFIAIVVLGIGAFSVHDNKRVEAALADLEAQKKAHVEEYSQKLATLNEREKALDTRERDLTARETALTEDQTALAAEKEAFYTAQDRIRELSGALYLELTPDASLTE